MSKYEKLSKCYKSLENEVQEALMAEIYASERKSKTVDTKCISVNVFDYAELVILHGELTFLDNDGYSYGVYKCSLEDLIDILNNI